MANPFWSNTLQACVFHSHWNLFYWLPMASHQAQRGNYRLPYAICIAAPRMRMKTSDNTCSCGQNDSPPVSERKTSALIHSYNCPSSVTEVCFQTELNLAYRTSSIRMYNQLYKFLFRYSTAEYIISLEKWLWRVQLGHFMLSVSAIVLKNNKWIKTFMANFCCSNGDLTRPSTL